MTESKKLSLKEIINFLDQYVISQDEAKKQIAVAIRNKYRRELLDEEWKNEITPFNMLLIGPTGSGKTELFRTLARMLDVAFTKVDISGYTSSGYVGKDVDDIISVHLYESAKRKALASLEDDIKDEIYDKIYRELARAYLNQKSDKSSKKITGSAFFTTNDSIEGNVAEFEYVYNSIKNRDDEKILKSTVSVVRMILDKSNPMINSVPPQVRKQFMEEKIFTDTIENLIDELYEIDVLDAIENNTKVNKIIKHYMENGIVFIDEIDKIADKDTSRVDTAGVQKELLTLIEGKTVMTEIGPVNTDKILFIAAGAFHTAKPSDLLPELLGRLPIKVVLQSLDVQDYYRILTEPKYNIINKIVKLYEVDGIKLKFTDDALEEIARYAYELNKTENLGARRLHTLVNMIISDLDFELEEKRLTEFTIDKEYVINKIDEKDKQIKKALEYIEDTERRKIGFIA